jgi:Flp pilus assembly protein TadG
MIRGFIKKFRRDRRGATALIMALSTVPLLIASGVAVDFSRVSSARAQLQAAVDAAALAGTGAYQNSTSGTNASAVAKSVFASSTASLTSYVAITGSATVNGASVTNGVTVKTGCYDNSADGGALCTSPSTNLVNANGQCVNAGYCVNVTATGTLTNSLLAFVIPKDVLSVSAYTIVPLPASQVTINNFPSTSIGTSNDESGVYAYAVPRNGSTYNYDSRPAVTTNCTNDGPIAYTPNQVTPTHTADACPYLEIGDSNGTAPATGSLSLAYAQPISFLFVNDTGKTHLYGPDSSDPIPCTVASCGQTTKNGYNLYGYCPAWTLYGSITQFPDNSGVNKVPVQDSLHTYSSAYEMEGLPPTHNSNNAITSFSITYTSQEQTGTSNGNATTSSITYTEQCPDAPWGTGTNATYASAYASYYPDTQYSDGNAVDIFPQTLTACHPDANGNWNYSGSNISFLFCAAQQTTNYNNCALLIQDIGHSQPTTLPDYYKEAELNGVTQYWVPVWDNGSYPTSTSSVPNPNGDGTTLVSEQPSSNFLGGAGYDHHPPASTSSKCYDPAAGYDSATGYFGDTAATLANEDAVENPQLGAVTCTSNPPESYVLFWNDMGYKENDDLGYWNADVLFTCSLPSKTTTSGGPPRLTG